MRILIIGEDEAMVESAQALLEKKGFRVETVCDGRKGEAFAQMGGYDLLILDMKMPGIDGYRMLRQIRLRNSAVPILILTSAQETEERITGLNAGADLCLNKPVDSRELLAAINALLRRRSVQPGELCFGSTSLDLAFGTLNCGGRSVRLSARELDVMRLLLQSQKQILGKEVILAQVWGCESNAVENHVEVYVGFLRKKLRAIDSDLRIEAIRRMGYHLVPAENLTAG